LESEWCRSFSLIGFFRFGMLRVVVEWMRQIPKFFPEIIWEKTHLFATNLGRLMVLEFNSCGLVDSLV
jgi:hypothetical protein